MSLVSSFFGDTVYIVLNDFTDSQVYLFIAIQVHE